MRTELGLVALRQIRIHQWLKNIIVFVPLLTSHLFLKSECWLPEVLAFLSFSFMASAGYIFNDLMDVGADRAHPLKRNRPIASGSIRSSTGIGWMIALIGGSCSFFPFLPKFFALAMIIYFLASVVYSLWIKKIPGLDLIWLSGFYTARIFAGALAIQISVSHWLLIFSIFFFFGLALLKRNSDLLAYEGPGRVGTYTDQDRSMITHMGISSSLISILTLMLYFGGQTAAALYRNPSALWLLTPIFLYWTARIWFLSLRGQLSTDPVLFVLVDRTSWLLGVAIAAIFWISV